MRLYYNNYILEGTVDEIRDFIVKETPTTVSTTSTLTLSTDTDDYIKDKLTSIINTAPKKRGPKSNKE